MRNSAARVLTLVATAIWLCAAAAALAATEGAAPELTAEPSPLSPPNGMFNTLQRDMLMLKERLADVVAPFRICRKSAHFCCGGSPRI